MTSISSILVLLFGVFALCRGHPVVQTVDDDTSAMQEIFDQNKGNIDELAFIDVKMTPAERHPDGAMGAIIKKTSGRLWENKLVYYSFDNRAFNTVLKNLVRTALNKIEAVTCIRFKEYPMGQAPGHFVRIISSSGCWSYIGKTQFQGQNYQDLSLQIPGCVNEKVTQHEFIHALGAFHEQARPDRDSYINLFPENMVDNAWGQFKKQESVDSLNVGYDADSIMHYSSYAFSRNGKPTMQRKDNPSKRLGGAVLSKKDILQLNLLYSCGPEPPTTTPTTPMTTTPTTTTTTTTAPTTTTTTATTTTKMTTPMTTTTTGLPPKDCIDKLMYCSLMPTFLCVQSKRVPLDCPKRCGKCETKTTPITPSTTPMTTTTTPMTTTTTPTTTDTTPTTTDTTTESSTYHCEDLSRHCVAPRCGQYIYKMRCRNACGLCNTPLPSRCTGKEDSDRTQCAMYAKQGRCNTSFVRNMCKASCCLYG